MTSSLTPTVEEKKPTDQNSLRQYIFLIQGKRLRISRLVLALIFPTMADTAYVGGSTITTCIGSTWILNVSISTSGWNFSVSNKPFSRYCLSSPFRTFLRYLGIQTT